MKVEIIDKAARQITVQTLEKDIKNIKEEISYLKRMKKMHGDNSVEEYNEVLKHLRFVYSYCLYNLETSL